MSGEMLRQKKYHDTRRSWSSFEARDLVYVYFPIRKSRCCLYTITCGSRDRNTVMHCDSMRKYQPQILKGETEENLVEREDHLVDEQFQNNVLVAHYKEKVVHVKLEDHGVRKTYLNGCNTMTKTITALRALRFDRRYM